MTIIYDDILKEELAKITPLERRTSQLSDGIAQRIDDLMKQKGITKSQLAKMTGHRPCEVTKWLGGGHNFTCRTLALISLALGADLIIIPKTKQVMSANQSNGHTDTLQPKRKPRKLYKLRGYKEFVPDPHNLGL